MECQIAHQILATGIGLLVGFGAVGVAVVLGLTGIARAIRESKS